VRKEIHRQAQERGAAQDHHGQREHQDADAVSECKEGQPHKARVKSEKWKIGSLVQGLKRVGGLVLERCTFHPSLFTGFNGCASTTVPSLTRSLPETITCSEPVKPLVTSMRFSTLLPTSTGTWCAAPFCNT